MNVGSISDRCLSLLWFQARDQVSPRMHSFPPPLQRVMPLAVKNPPWLRSNAWRKKCDVRLKA